MFVCKNCIDRFEPVVALATFYKTCEICGEMRDCLDLAPNVKRIDTPKILELIIEHKDGKFINWSMRDPNNPTRKFGEDDVALIQQVVGEFHPKEPKEGKMSEIEKAKRLLGDIQVLLHPAKLGIELEDEAAFLTVNAIDAYCKSIDVQSLLENMEEPLTERFQLQIDKYDEMIALLKDIIKDIKEDPPTDEMLGRAMDANDPPSIPTEEPECEHCAGTGEAKLDEFGDVLYSGEFGPCPYCNIPAPPREPIKGIVRRHALDPLCLECYQAIKEGKNECPKCHQVLLPREDPPPTEEEPSPIEPVIWWKGDGWACSCGQINAPHWSRCCKCQGVRPTEEPKEDK